MVEKTDVIGIALIVTIVIFIPAGVAQLNDWKIGPADEPIVVADNLLTGTYDYENSTGGAFSSSLTVSYLSGENEEYFEITVPTEENASDQGPDSVTIKFNEPKAQTVIDKGIIELYTQGKATVDNYDNMGLTIKYDGTSTITLMDNSDVEATQNFSHIEEISTDYAWTIKNQCGENATPKMVLTNPSGDNKLLSEEIIEARSWGYDASTSVALTHKGVWQASMLLMGVASMFAAVLATAKLDLEFN